MGSREENHMNMIASTVLFFATLTLSLACAHASRRQTAAFATVRMSALEDMPILPKNVIKYSQVPAKGSFTADKIPRGLLKEHSTKKGTWGIIRVDKGSLEYQIHEPAPLRIFELNAPAKGVIEPTVLHQVKALSDNLEFVVEFYRMPGTGPVDEKREGL